MNTTKRLRGSALISEEGTFTFTPFASVPEKEKKMQLLFESHYGSLWLAKNKVSVRMVFDRKWVPPFPIWIEEMTQMYNSLIQYSHNEL